MSSALRHLAPHKIISVDLSKEIQEIPACPDYEWLYLLFWWRTIPLGHREISTTMLPLSTVALATLAAQEISSAVGDRLFEQGFKAPLPQFPTQLRQNTSPTLTDLMAIKQPLTQLDEHFATPGTDSISVVICTRDRPEQLARCLESLQQSAQRPLEIVVVDNAPSSDATRRLVEQRSAIMPEIKYVLEPRPGLDVARNAGIRNSRGNIVAFTDDDVTVHPDWVMRLQQSFRTPEVMAVTGLVLAGELETEAQLIFEKYWSFNRGYRALTYDRQYFEHLKPYGVPVWCIGAGANMAFRRSIFERAGEFDERLDVGAAGCSGDSEFWYRVLAEGGMCRYEPAAVVYHYHRREMERLKHQMFFYMRGHVSALFIQYERYKHVGNLRRVFISLPRYYFNLFLQGIKQGFRFRYSTLFAEISGCLSGLKFYWTNRVSTRPSRLHL